MKGDSEKTWDKLADIYELINNLLQTTALVEENEPIRFELLTARVHIVRAQALT
jgi:hypothetical protein